MGKIVTRMLKTKLKVNLGKQALLQDISLPACDIHNNDHTENNLTEIERLIRKKFFTLVYEEILLRRRIHKQQVENS